MLKPNSDNIKQLLPCV